MSEQLFTVNGLSDKTGVDRRTIKKYLVGKVPPRGKDERGNDAWSVADLETAINRDGTAPDLNALKCKKLVEDIRKVKIGNDIKSGALIPKARVIESIQRILPQAVALIEQKLVMEYPTAVAGLDVPQARVYGRRLGDELIKGFHSFSKEWVK